MGWRYCRTTIGLAMCGELESVVERAVVLTTSETIPLGLLSVSAGRVAGKDRLPSLNLHQNLE